MSENSGRPKESSARVRPRGAGLPTAKRKRAAVDPRFEGMYGSLDKNFVKQHYSTVIAERRGEEEAQLHQRLQTLRRILNLYSLEKRRCRGEGP